MALYSYIKLPPKPNRKIVNAVSYSSMIVGSLFLFWSFYPIIFFQIYSEFFIKNKVTTPIPKRNVISPIEATNSVLGTYSIFSTNLSDYTKAGMWFPSVTQEKNSDIKISEYKISVSRLNIQNAKVIVGGEDLNKGLIHFLPKVIPGENGSVVIFGHSILPALARPASELHYKSIFTYLPSMERGDTINVAVNGINLEYEVIDIFVVKPTDISVLDQHRDDSYLSLITCVPQGTYNLRLVVKSRLKRL